ncbi:carboxypeptidase inhibitor SmCI-like isoform X2 [Amblyomma americanum]
MKVLVLLSLFGVGLECTAQAPNTITLLAEEETEGGSQTSNPDIKETDPQAFLDCFVEADKGPCDKTIYRYNFEPESATCNLFAYGGCEGNRNNYNSEEECMAKCNPLNEYNRKCLIKPKEGRCRMLQKLWTYNVTLAQCQQFWYVGCMDNDNKYRTKEECEMTCLRQPGNVNPLCFEPKYPGPCGAHYPRYYYNRWSKTCEKFIYGGCRGNENNFETLEECENTCWVSRKQDPADVSEAFQAPFRPWATPLECTYPAEAGRCLAYMPRFYYNATTQSCEQFIYGGCGGNANNFYSYADCESKCKTSMGILSRA